MTIDIDDEKQAELDDQEAAMAEATGAEVTGQAGPAEDDEELKKLYQRLEAIDREIIRVELDKKETAKEFREELAGLAEQRQSALDRIDGYKQGERGLPFNAD